MAMVSITEAAKLAGISRNYFYKKYLNTGLISISMNESGKVAIDTSELTRVFISLHSEQTKVTQYDRESMVEYDISDSVLLEKIKGLEVLLKAKEDELESYRDREKYLYHLLENNLKKERVSGFDILKNRLLNEPL